MTCADDHDAEARQAAIGYKITWIPSPSESVSGSKTTIFCVSIRQNTSCSYLFAQFRDTIVNRAPCVRSSAPHDPMSRRGNGAMMGRDFRREHTMDYRDRHIVVTGGAGALGTAVVSALLEAGAVCHVPCRTPEEAQRFAHRDHAGVKVSAPVDLGDEAAVEKLYAGVPKLWASLHIAGGFAAAPIEKTGKADLLRQVETNLVSAFLCSRAAVRAMGQNGGRIVNVAASRAIEWRTGAGMTAYTASKAAVAALTVALAEEVVSKGILVNAVAPSIMDTAANRAAMPKADHGKWPKVEEVAATILFLASPDNKVTRGAIVPVYGRS
jgi:NAD(P)-dependent dehydrogenase (short-subunit alcohol dehydrogenase family)